MPIEAANDSLMVSLPDSVVERAATTILSLLSTLNRIAHDGPNAIGSVLEAQGIARSASSDGARHLAALLNQARATAAPSA